MNRSNSYVQLSLLSVTVLLFGMFVFPGVYAETVSITTSISPITILFDEFISLLDTSVTGNLTSVSVTANLPCDSNNTPLLTIVAGILGDTTNIIDSSSDFIGNGPRDTCIFRDNITNVTAANIPAINSVFLNHTGSSPVHIPQGVMVTLSGVFGNPTTEPISSGIVATGGTITNFGGKTIHTFTSSGTFTVTGTGNVNYLVVAGGGGAGGYLNGTDYIVISQAYAITVGSGGAGGVGADGIKGSDSTFDTITSEGGGFGGYGNPSGGNGGDGGSGGSGVYATATNGQGTVGQGNDADRTGAYSGGGGGCLTDGNIPSGQGAHGCSTDISGLHVVYATGGTAATGSTAGIVNTGNGANSGISVSGAAGGSGIVIISYDTP